MQHHGLGHMPQPDNFTTCGKLGIEVNQYNNPMEVSEVKLESERKGEKIRTLAQSIFVAVLC